MRNYISPSRLVWGEETVCGKRENTKFQKILADEWREQRASIRLKVRSVQQKLQMRVLTRYYISTGTEC